MSFITDICSGILESAIVTDVIDTNNTVGTSDNMTSTEDWGYLFMPDPIAGGSENIETLYE